MKYFLESSFAMLASAALVNGHNIRRQGEDGWAGRLDPKTDKRCDFFEIATNKSMGCAYFEEKYSLTHKQFVAWNPSVKEDCSGLKVDHLYCVQLVPSKDGVPPPTSTKGPNGIETPLPFQQGMVDNCNTFYLTKNGDTCNSIAAAHNISSEQFETWNAAVGGSDCTKLWNRFNVCVGVTEKAPAISARQLNCGSEPRPPTILPNTVCDCKSWYVVHPGESCRDIGLRVGIGPGDFFGWNPDIHENCDNLPSSTWICVSH